MGSFSIWHWLIVLVVVLVLFGGGGKLSKLMGDMGKGVTSFKKGLKEGGDADKGKVEAKEEEPKVIDPQPAPKPAEAEVVTAEPVAEPEKEKDKTAASG